MIKLICLDIDGTLIRTDHTVSKRNIEAIKKATQKGVYVTIASGRMFPSASFFGEEIGINAPIITMNGAYVKDPKTLEEISKVNLKEEEIKVIIDVLDKYQLYPNFYNKDTMYVTGNLERYEEMNKVIPIARRFKVKPLDKDKYWYLDMLKDNKNEIFKGITFPKNLDKKEEIKKEILSKIDISIVESHISNYEFNSKKATKGNAVLSLANFLNIKNDEIMTVGDSENDLSMIKAVENSVAMGNASELIKRNAKHLTLSNDEDGVAHIIEKLVL